MKREQSQPERIASRSAGTVRRFLLVSAFLGLLIGLFEAELLWTTPRVIPLLVPDVGWVVWFLAPLVDMTFFALVGLGLGLLASRTAHKELFVAAGAGIAVTFVTLMLAWFHREIGLHPFDFLMEFIFPLGVFAVAFVASLVVLAFAWRRLAAPADRWLAKLAKPLARGIAACAAVALAGIGAFVVRPSFSGTRIGAAPPPQGAPNIVFITLDTVRANHLSSYGYPRPTTPNIDRFARTGVLFENAIAPSSWTLASHASMFTGLLPQQHGADWAVPLAESPWTLAEVLRSQGYQTAGFAANDDYMQEGWGIAQGFGSYYDNKLSFKYSLAQTLLGKIAVQPTYQSLWQYDSFYRRDAAEVNGSVYRWYPNRSERPFFLFINYFDVHDPYITNRVFQNRFGTVPNETSRQLRFIAETAAARDDFGIQAKKSLIAGYDNCLAYLDDQIGKLLEFLQRSPEWQNTIVILTSDHGEEFGGHGSYEHGRDLYRGVLHVPLIIAGPGIPQGVRVGQLAATRRLFSTVLDLAGHGNTPFSRTSLARFWRPEYKAVPSDDAVVSELELPGDLTDHRMVSLTTPDWQYIEHRDGRQELYNWQADPKEHKNLAAVPGEHATLDQLRSRLVDLLSGAVGPWIGPQYLDALNSISGPARLGLLRPQPFQPDAPGYRIGMAQAYFKPDESAPTRPSQSERELMRSLPYQ